MLKVDGNTINDVEDKLGRFYKKAPNVIVRALNRAAMNARTNAVNKARENYNIKATDVRKTITIRKANKNALGAMVISKGSTVPLIKFKVSPKKRTKKRKAIKAAVKKGPLKEVGGAFIGDVHGSKVFKRVGNSRLPINRLFGPSIPQMLGNRSVKEYIETEAIKIFDKRLTHEINRVK